MVFDIVEILSRPRPGVYLVVIEIITAVVCGIRDNTHEHDVHGYPFLDVLVQHTGRHVTG